MNGPELSIVVASHDRPLRLRWLLNALEAQTLPRSYWELIVCHDSRTRETDELLGTHALALDGTLTALRRPPSTAAAKRNAALAHARAPSIVFTDDDCRPPEDWLEHALAAARADPEAIIQGRVEGDPDEAVMRRAAFARTQHIARLPGPWAETANIVYPRALLEAVGGFAEEVASAEDTELGIRARSTGAPYFGAPAMLTHHAIEDGGVLGAIRAARRWRDVPWLVKRHPEARGWLTCGVFWKLSHPLLGLAVGAAVAATLAGRRRAVLLVLPWAALPRTGRRGPRGRLRDVLELPGAAAIELAEIAVLARGSFRHRSLVL